MQIDITALSLIGQTVEHYDRWNDDPNRKDRYIGMTATTLSRLTKVHRVTAYRNLEWLVEHGFATIETETYRNTIRKRYFPTDTAVNYWHKFKPTNEGKKVAAFIAARWMKWYQAQVKKVYQELGMKPPFRV